MRLAIVHPEIEVFDEYEGGALARWTAEVARRLPEDVRTTVLTRPARGHPYADCRAVVRPMRSGALARVPLLRRRLAQAYGREVLRRLGRDDPDVVHLHARPQWVEGIRRRVPRARVLLHLQNDHLTPWAPDERARLLREVDALVCCSRDLAARSTAGVAPEALEGGAGAPRAAGKVHVLFNGVDVRRFAPADRPADDPSGTRCVVYLGRLSPEKAPHLTMEAVLRLRRRGHRVRMLLVGASGFGTAADTPYVRRLRDLAREDPGAFEFTGYVHSRDLPARLRLGDVYVHACTWPEPFGMATAEAMACGFAPVVSRRGANLEVAGDASLSFEPTDPPDELVAVLEPLLADPERLRRAGEAARRRAVALFDWDVVAARYVALLRDLAARPA